MYIWGFLHPVAFEWGPLYLFPNPNILSKPIQEVGSARKRPMTFSKAVKIICQAFEVPNEYNYQRSTANHQASRSSFQYLNDS